jgi:GNAT superfamily N-acetyltransferase
MAEGFGMPTDLVRQLLDVSLLATEGYAAVLAFVDGAPASTAALMVTDDIAGIYNVATPDRFRRRGLGEATTRAAVAEGARRGCTVTTLQASEMGYPTYERMGYRTVARWLTFTG